MPKKFMLNKIISRQGDMTVPQATDNPDLGDGDIDKGVDEELQLLAEMEPEQQAQVVEMVKKAIREWINSKSLPEKPIGDNQKVSLQ